jgi:hypothetical protein
LHPARDGRSRFPDRHLAARVRRPLEDEASRPAEEAEGAGCGGRVHRDPAGREIDGGGRGTDGDDELVGRSSTGSREERAQPRDQVPPFCDVVDDGAQVRGRIVQQVVDRVRDAAAVRVEDADGLERGRETGGRTGRGRPERFGQAREQDPHLGQGRGRGVNARRRRCAGRLHHPTLAHDAEGPGLVERQDRARVRSAVAGRQRDVEGNAAQLLLGTGARRAPGIGPADKPRVLAAHARVEGDAAVRLHVQPVAARSEAGEIELEVAVQHHLAHGRRALRDRKTERETQRVRLGRWPRGAGLRALPQARGHDGRERAAHGPLAHDAENRAHGEAGAGGGGRRCREPQLHGRIVQGQ